MLFRSYCQVNDIVDYTQYNEEDGETKLEYGKIIEIDLLNYIIIESEGTLVEVLRKEVVRLHNDEDWKSPVCKTFSILADIFDAKKDGLTLKQMIDESDYPFKNPVPSLFFNLINIQKFIEFFYIYYFIL